MSGGGGRGRPLISPRSEGASTVNTQNRAKYKKAKVISLGVYQRKFLGQTGFLSVPFRTGLNTLKVLVRTLLVDPDLLTS